MKVLLGYKSKYNINVNLHHPPGERTNTTCLKSINIQDGDGGGVLVGVHLSVDPVC